MSFAELMSDKVELLKTNGEKIPSSGGPGSSDRILSSISGRIC
jgi:hypothetical protein